MDPKIENSTNKIAPDENKALDMNKNKSRFSKKKFFLFLLILIIFLIIAVFAAYMQFVNSASNSNKNNSELSKEETKNSWVKHKNVYGTYLWDDLFLTTENNTGGGIVLLGPNYKEQRATISADILDLTTNKSENYELLSNVPFLTAWRLIPDSKNRNILIFVGASKLICDENEEDPFCKNQLFSFDFNTKTATIEATFDEKTRPLSNNEQYYFSLSPLAYDSEREIIWFKEGINFSNKNKKGLSEYEQLYDTRDSLISYNLKTKSLRHIDLTGKVSDSTPSYWGDSLSFYEKRPVADIDKNGNLYVITRKNDENLNETFYLEKATPNSSSIDRDDVIPIYKFWIDDFFPLYHSELTINKNKNMAYIVTNSWDGGDQSHIISYNLDTGSFNYISHIPEGYGDDARGVLSYNNLLLVSFTKGIGIYNFEKDSWSLITGKEGLLRSDSRDLVQLDDNRIYVTNGKSGMSCTEKPFPEYTF